MKKLLLFALLSAGLFSACKKKDEVVVKTTAEKILGKWIVVTGTDNLYFNNTNHISTYSGTANDVDDFRTDGRVYEGPTFTSSSPYSVISDSKVLINGISTDINSLTDAQLILHAKVPGTGTDFHEYTVTYKR